MSESEGEPAIEMMVKVPDKDVRVQVLPFDLAHPRAEGR